MQGSAAWQTCWEENHSSVADLAKESWMLMCSRNFTFEIGSEWCFSMQTYTEESENLLLGQRYLKSHTKEVMGWDNRWDYDRSDSLLGFGSAKWCMCTRLLLVSIYCCVWRASWKDVGWEACAGKTAPLAQSLLSAYALGGYRENVWEQTDMQSPWVIPCVPSVLFCLLSWDANIMNFNWKRKIFWWKHILRWGKYKLQNNSWTICSSWEFSWSK